ncbi:MAG: hypothetical protein M3O36_00185 [Myxococcota bacterium]|nr:hypothetical protein [Myxococcota bacterium]
MNRTLTAAALCVACGCSSSSPSARPTTTDGGTAFKHDIVFTMDLTVPKATELHQCQFVQLPPGPDIYFTGFAHAYTKGSHHFLLYLTDLTSIPADMAGQQYDCTTGDEPVMQHAAGILYGAQLPTGAASFPAGVAAKLQGGQVLIMNTHFLNAGSTDLATNVTVGLDTTTSDKVTQEGGFFIFYDAFIDVPAGAKASSGASCPVPADVHVITGFTHYHQRGTQMQVFNDLEGQPRAATPFFTTTDWEHPEQLPATTWPKGSSIRYQCDYMNNDPDEVFQGPNAKTSEMCVLAGLYYPKQANSFAYCNQGSWSGFGTNACLSLAQCVQACPADGAPRKTATGALVGPCWERCVASGCDGAVDALLPLVTCVNAKCSAECQAGNCLACTVNNCGTEFSACSSQTCL